MARCVKIDERIINIDYVVSVAKVFVDGRYGNRLFMLDQSKITLLSDDEEKRDKGFELIYDTLRS